MGAARAILEELRRERALAAVLAASVAALVCVALLAALWDGPSSDVRNYGLIVAAIIAFPLAIWRSLVAHRQARAGESQAAAAAEQARLADAGETAARMFRAAELLGSDNPAVRLTGVRMLERIADDHPGVYDDLVREILQVERAHRARRAGT